MKGQLGEAAEVLGDCRERELELRACRSSQSQATEPQDALQVCEQHLDLLAITPGLFVGGRLGDGAGDVACRLVIDAA